MGKTVVEFDKESRRQLTKAIYTENRRLRIGSKEAPRRLREGSGRIAYFLEIIAHFCKIIACAIGCTIRDYSLKRK